MAEKLCPFEHSDLAASCFVLSQRQALGIATPCAMSPLCDAAKLVLRENADESLSLTNAPDIKVYSELDMTVKEFDNKNQSNWLMPNEYYNLDIAKFVLDQCIHLLYGSCEDSPRKETTDD